MKFKYMPHISWQKYIDTIYVFNEKNNEIYLFKDTSLDIWEAIGKKCEFEEIVEYLIKEYDCEYEEFKQDCYDFIIQLKENDLVLVEKE